MALRLIETTTLKLTDFEDEAIPEYAILSHTWVKAQEVSYQEMVDINRQPANSAQQYIHPAQQKSGYRKIQKACEVSRNEGWRYLWVDTCCIDQSSSADQSEAINSMFRWYQAAKLCIAYLSDLSPRLNVEETMRQCRWFQRGWCLQELVAPKLMNFYNGAWQCIGSKSSTDFRHLISKISKIDDDVLAEPRLIFSRSVAERMAWAAHRSTTKREDMAYCLLGIFEVHMPLLYGEGERAFMRLQEEIMKRTNDLSIFSWGHPHRTMPLQRDTTNGAGYDQHVGGMTQLNFNNEARDDGPHAIPIDFCDLLAKSHRDFANCESIVLQNWIKRRNFAFEMTNNGLSFTHMKFIADFKNDCYLLPLFCHDAKSPHVSIYLALRKVGPDLFVRTQRRKEADLFYWNRTIDGYIVTTINPETRDFIEQSRVQSVQLHSSSCSKEKFYHSMMIIFPEEAWDLSTLTFLPSEEEVCSGYIKFSRKMLNETITGTRTQAGDDFYLAWGPQTIRTRSNDYRESLWIRLYWAREWISRDNPWDEDGRHNNGSRSSQLDQNRLQWDAGVVRARLSKRGEVDSEYFRISLDINPR
jgi:Heterokaryon incompatibility protein (HET)